MNPKRAIVAATFALMTGAAFWPAMASADVEMATQGDIKYANGGFGMDEQQAMHKAAKDYNLRLMFSEGKRGAFVADVKVTVSDKAGHPVFHLDQAGPMTDVSLPAGRYRVSAEYRDKCMRRSVDLGKKQGKQLNFNWPAPPDEQ